MQTLDIIDRLPFELAARLVCDPFFMDVPVIVAEAGNIKLEMERKQAVITEKNGKRGAAVIVLQLVADDKFENVHGPMQLFPSFQVIENVELNNDDNGTRKSHRKIARRIVQLIKTFQMDGYIQSMKAAKPCIEPTDLTELSALLKGSQVNFECSERLTENLSFVAVPQFASAVVEGVPQFTLTSGTPDAEIWFTADDSFPYNGDKDVYPGSTAQRYTGAINIPEAGVTVRACAYLAGSIASGVVRRQIYFTN